MSEVLIVDDSPSIRLLVKRRLEMAGHHVVEAGDGCEAITILEGPERGDGVELVIIDAAMPRLSGAEALGRIKELWPDLPVIGLSASLDLGESPEWSSAADFIEKPIDFEHLLGQVERLTTGRSQP